MRLIGTSISPPGLGCLKTARPRSQTSRPSKRPLRFESSRWALAIASSSETPRGSISTPATHRLSGLIRRNRARTSSRRWPRSRWPRCGRPGWLRPSMEKPQAQNAGDDQKGGHDIAQQPRHDQNEDAGDKRDDGLQVTDAKSHFTLLIASDAGAATGLTDCRPIAANTSQNKR